MATNRVTNGAPHGRALEQVSTDGAVHNADLNQAPDPEEVDIATSLQALSVKENNEVSGRTSSGVTSRKAKEIRKQVDFYFSAENLQRDMFLLKQMNGSKNRPVPLKVIADFGKMQKYRPVSTMVEALQTSKTVNVVQHKGQTCLQRKEAFHRTNLASAAGPPKAKPTAATGFEDYYADAPLTPDAAREEQELYDIDLPVTERIETAVKRYQVRRKMHSFAKNVFDKWLMYGGVDSSPIAFGGGPSPEELASMTTKEKKAAAAHVNVFASECDDDGNPRWTVDFVGVTKSFLSRILPDIFDLDSAERLREATNVIENFFRYLNYHNVCPEHVAEINAARKVCHMAAQELMDTYRLQRRLPGPFNTACSTLFGGRYDGQYAVDQDWMKGKEHMKLQIGQSDTQAKQLFMTGMVALELDQAPLNSKVVKVDADVGLEVVSITPRPAETAELYETLGAGYTPLGTLICKPWTPPEFAEWDLSPGASPVDPTTSDTYTFHIEQDLLDLCYIGLKMEATVRTLDSGIQWLDEVTAMRCSFYTLMENELVKGWKEPRWWTREELLERAASLAARGKMEEDVEDGADVVDD